MVRPKLTGANVLNLAGIIIAVYLIVVLAHTVRHNYQLNQQVAQLNVDIANLNSQKQELNYDIQYYGTDSFKERQARAKLGLQLPGENVLVLPQPSVTPTPIAQAPASTKKKRSNFRQWMDFLSGNG